MAGQQSVERWPRQRRWWKGREAPLSVQCVENRANVALQPLRGAAAGPAGMQMRFNLARLQPGQFSIKKRKHLLERQMVIHRRHSAGGADC